MNLVKAKKGVEAQTILQIFWIVIAAAAILLFIHVGTSIWKIFSNEQDQGTKESFKILIEKIGKLKDNESTEQLYYIKPDFVLYGFNKDAGKIYYNRPIQIENLPVIGGNLIQTPSVNKPKKCGSAACICICDAAECNGKIQDCKLADGIEHYAAEKMERNQGTQYSFKDSNNNQINAHYLAIFGKKGGFAFFSDEWKVRPIKIRRENNAVYFSDAK